MKSAQVGVVVDFSYTWRPVTASEGVAEPLNSKSLRIDYSRQTLKLSDSDRIFGSREFKI